MSKLTQTQQALLIQLGEAREALDEACKDYWTNIKIPEYCAVVPYVRAVGAREKRAAEALVEAGRLVRIARFIYTTGWKDPD